VREECDPSIEELDFGDLKLVHGKVNRNNKPGEIPKRIKHEWLEFNGCVIEHSGSNKLIIGTDAYYA